MYNLRARCWYQLHLCRAEAAAARTPDSLVRLSLFGWTLGGIFVAAWDDSPLGPYKECALMAGLALAPRSLTLGAWPRPLLVTSAGAVVAGRDVFGHADTVLADIDLARDGDDDIVFTLEGEARPSVRVPEVLLPSEATASDDVPDASAASTLSLPLPSLSGSAGNLCVYDLLVPLVSGVARLAPTARVRVEGAAAEGSDAAALLDGPALLAVSLGPCVVVASEPRPAQARARTSGGHSRRAAVLAPLASLAGALGAHAAVAGEGDDARAVLARDMRASPVRPALTVRAYVAALEAALPAYDNILRNGMAAVAEGDAPYSDLARLADALVIAPCDDVVQVRDPRRRQPESSRYISDRCFASAAFARALLVLSAPRSHRACLPKCTRSADRTNRAA